MKLIQKINLLIFSMVIIVILIFCYSYYTIKQPFIKNDALFMVNKGEGINIVINNLEKQQLLSRQIGTLIKLILKIPSSKYKINVKMGEYQFKHNSSMLDIIKQLLNGNVYYRKITIAEGLSNDSIFKIINSTYGLSGELTNIEEIIEGSLLPETYLYTYGESKNNIIKRMQQDMTNFLNKEWEKRDKNLPFSTKEEAISLASIVEKETGIPEERYKVASVFINRLRKKMKLQSDPTVIYTFAKGNKDLEREIRKSDLKTYSEYNTYMIYGIPKLPIANPGKDSIMAVLHPIDTDYIYFVATGNGGHNFSNNLKDHNKYVIEYRKIMKEKN